MNSLESLHSSLLLQCHFFFLRSSICILVNKLEWNHDIWVYFRPDFKPRKSIDPKISPSWISGFISTNGTGKLSLGWESHARATLESSWADVSRRPTFTLPPREPRRRRIWSCTLLKGESWLCDKVWNNAHSFIHYLLSIRIKKLDCTKIVARDRDMP